MQVRCLSVEGLLDGITVLRAVTAVEVCAAVEMLDQYLVEDASLGTTPVFPSPFRQVPVAL